MNRWLALLGAVMLAAAQSPPPVPPQTPPTAPARPAPTREELTRALEAQRKLDLAKLYLAENRFAEARKLLEEVLTVEPANLDAKGLLARLLQSENQRAAARQHAELDEAEWQLKTGNRDRAFERAREVADVAQDIVVRSRADALLERCRPGFFGQVRQLVQGVWFGWLFDLLAGVLLLLLLWLALRLLRRVYAWAGRHTWRIQAIDDKTNLGVGELAPPAFSRLRAGKTVAEPASAGLLRLEVLRLPSARDLLLKADEPAELAKSAEALDFKVGALELGAVAKLLLGLGRWFQSRLPSVSGMAFSEEALVTVRLRLTRPGGRTIAVSASAKKEAGRDAAQLAAERAVLQAYWWMVNPQATGAELGAIGALHEALGLLERHISGEPAAILEQALAKFAAVRLAMPRFWEAWLYEGIALVLLERHDDALLRFEHVAAHAAGELLRDKARYNQAVAQMRKFRPDSLRAAEELYKQVVGYAPDVVNQPVKALARAGWANAVAHYPVHWQALLHAGERAAGEAQLLAWKRDDVRQVFGWKRRALRLAGEVQADLETIQRSQSTAWDAAALRQLEWAWHNALGNAHLTVVTGFLGDTCPQEFDTVEQDKCELLSTALEHFQAAEMLLPPSAETLTNLGTARLFLCQREQAREYLTRAIALSPSLEYAHLRLAQSWDQDHQPEKVIAVLKAYQGPVATRHLQKLYADYKVPAPE